MRMRRSFYRRQNELQFWIYFICLLFIILFVPIPSVVEAQFSPISEPSLQDESISEIPKESLESAKQHCEKGEALFGEKKYDSALSEFEKAYQLLQGHPKRHELLYNIGKCHEKLGRYHSAVKSYQLYLDQGGPEITDRAEVEKALKENQEKAAEVDQIFAKGKSHFKQAKAFYQAKDYNAALAEFQAAYQNLLGHPIRFLVLFNVGRCYEHIFRYDLAIQSYRDYLDQAGPEAEDREMVQQNLESLKRLLGKLTIDTNVKAEVWIGDRLMGHAPGQVYIPGGRHMMELRARGYQTEKLEIQLTSGESQVHDFKLSQITEYKGLNQAYFWTGTALTALVLGGGITFGIRALSKDSEGREQSDKINKDQLKEQVDDLSLAADILYGTSALFAVGTVLLFFLTDWDSPIEQEKSGTGIQTSFIPSFTKDGVSLSFGGGL